MKKLMVFLLCLFCVFSLASCNKNEENKSKEAVVINLPEDDTVNGYRTGKKDTTDNTVISADSVGIDNPQYNNSGNMQNSNSKAYCGNKNSKVFHKIDCGSVSKMKESNKAYFNDRATAIQSGYKPCSNCEP